MATVGQLTTDEQAVVEDDVVVLTVPAEVGYLGVLRTATAGLAARLHFALDEIEDLRIAVDEACAMLLAIAVRGAELECRFAVTDDALTVEVGVDTVPRAVLPSTSSFAWKVLTALTTSAAAEATGQRATIRLLTRRLEPPA
jgi:serine/threonine-protein kinase RsbW